VLDFFAKLYPRVLGLVATPDPRVIFIKVLGFFAKLYLRVLGLVATSDPRVIFIILIITLNLHDPNLSGFDCNTRPNSIGRGSGCKVVS